MNIEIINPSDTKRMVHRPPGQRHYDNLKDYRKSLEKYIPWIKEQINNSEHGYISIRRYDLGVAVRKELKIIMGDRYKDRSLNTLYYMIIAVLYKEGIFAEFGCPNRERVFILRNKTAKDRLTANLRTFGECPEEEKSWIKSFQHRKG